MRPPLRSAVPLPFSFYARPTAGVARDLLGKVLVRGKRRARIVETEAYLDARDRASHARFGPAGRSSLMFGPPGMWYVYLVYGMHHCLNVVTEAEGKAGAVLIRAAEPLWEEDARMMSGPGKLCRAMGVTRGENGSDATDAGGGLFLMDDGASIGAVARSPRVGVDYAGPWAHRLLRYFIRDHPSVSR